MLGLSRFAPRATPLERSVSMEGRRGDLGFRYRVGPADDYVFTVDIWTYLDKTHPERHLGWWRFELPADLREARVSLDFDPIRTDSVILVAKGRRIDPVDTWHNPGYVFDPLADLELVLRDGEGAVRRQEKALLKFADRDILRAFYARQHAADGYRSADDAPFLPTLHAYKLQRLRRLFERHIPPGSRVVDVGCGRSLFTDLGVRLPFRVFAGDLDAGWVRDRAREVPDQRWGVFDAAAVPLADGSADALFAGEVIEHVTDVEATLREWWRVLRPGGVVILTTPNRDRLVSLAGGIERPYSRDHLRELSYRELTRALLPAAGFVFVEQSCLYLELWLRNLFDPNLVHDHLQRGGNHTGNRGLMRRLLPLGRLVPWFALGIVVVARKVAR